MPNAIFDSIKTGWRQASLKAKILWTLAAGMLGLLVVLAWWLQPFWRVSGDLASGRFSQPSRLYGRSVTLTKNGYVDPKNLARHLESVGYHPAAEAEPVRQGRYRVSPGRIEIFLRSFPTTRGWVSGKPLIVELAGGRIRALSLGGSEVEAAALEPPLLASYYGPLVEERRPVEIGKVPEILIHCVLAAEDENFFRHPGVSPKGIARALWANLRGGQMRQGGSTLTQQLVKNLYTNRERSLERKLQEGVLALLVEARYDKREILEAYLNEIYLGAAGGANVQGMGAAAWAYFGKEVGDLTLSEAATLAGIIPAPAKYSPLTHPEKALERRNLVLSRLAELEWAEPAVLEQARSEVLEVAPQPSLRRRAAYFADAVAGEVAARFGLEDLNDKGYSVLSTLSLSDQKSAEEAVQWGLGKLEQGWQKGSKNASPLQSALVSIDPRDGSILAYVGGRDYGVSQFDRASQARRQAGSAFKPVVYATALERNVVSPSTLVEDAPLTVTQGGRTWTPQNDDDGFDGWITVRHAVEKSINIPTARVALATGLPEIVKTAHRMGIVAPLEPYPALALGAFEVSPVELATVYATLAAGGIRPSVHAVNAVFDLKGVELRSEPLTPPEPVLSRETAYLLTSILQGVVDHGTAASIRESGLSDALAGKTGTTNGRRDSWFGGYAPNRATVVWVGYDDNASTRLSGSRAAVPIWARFTRGVRPAAGYPAFPVPSGIVSALVDPTTGELATDRCPAVVQEIFREGKEPQTYCVLHRGWFSGPADEPTVGVEVGDDSNDNNRPLRRWLRKIFGSGEAKKEPRPPG